MRVVNPYIVGNPIKDQSVFFGRQDIFRDVMQILRQPGSNAIVLYGQRRIGKTSVLIQLEKQLRQAGEFTPVYFDLQDKASKTLADVLYALAQHIARVTGHPAPRLTDFDPAGDYFRTVFLPEVTGRVASGGLVLLFDEFDVLDTPLRTKDSASEAFFPYLQKWMDNVEKVKFVFVIGRRPEDLSVRTMAAFKGIQSTRVSFLSPEDAYEVVVQSETNESLFWEREAVDHLLALTHGHPYFTQLLCSVIWENAHEEAPETTPRVTTPDVENAVVHSLRFGANAFNWIWDGLPPAERVVVAAMAEIPEELITLNKLIETLNSSGVRLVARELEVAPETLIDWEVLIAADGAFRFAVPLLRRWVHLNRPLRRVKEELDRLNPLAENLYQSGQGLYSNGQLEPAEQQLRLALNVNPNHLKARLLLGQVLLERGNLSESVATFDAAYQYDERAARAELIKALLALADTQEENLQLSTYQRILSIQSEQPLANEKIRAIWVRRGEEALAQENFEEALKAFEQIGDTSRVETVRERMHDKRLSIEMQRAEHYENTGQWKLALDTLLELIPEYPESETLQARMETARLSWREDCMQKLYAADRGEDWLRVLELCESLEKDFPGDSVIQAHAERAHRQLGLTQEYRDALAALQSGENERAKQLLSHILAENPAHLQAAHKLIETTYGKVKILAPVPLPVQIAALISTALWTIVFLFLASGLVAELVVDSVMMDQVAPYYLNTETFILIGVILIPLVGVLLGSYTTSVIDNTYQVDREQPSYTAAIGAHLILGMGMFYVNPRARRKWLYLWLALLVAVLVLSMIFYEATRAMTIGVFHMEKMSDGQVSTILELMLWVFLGLFLLSFVDVIVNCYWERKRYFARKSEERGKSAVPTDAGPRTPPLRESSSNLARVLSFLPRHGETSPGAIVPRNNADAMKHIDSLYVVLDKGAPLYASLPAWASGAIWLPKGARLTVLEQNDDVLAKIGKQGNHIEVMDSQGNHGFVVAAAVSAQPPSGEKDAGVATQPGKAAS